MNLKNTFYLAILALVVAGVALFFAVGQEGGKVSDIKDLREEVQDLKGSLPNFWGGWPATGFMISVDDGPTVYFTGDTDLMLNWEAIGEYYKPDIVIATHSVVYQNGLDEWVYAVNKMKTPKYVLPSHHKTFPFYPKDDKVFAQKITEQTQADGVRLPDPGEPFELMGVEFTWTAHAGFVMETPQGSRIGLDPQWSMVSASAFPPSLKSAEAYGADLILLTHGHFDHYDPAALDVLLEPTEGTTPHLLTIFELGSYIQKQLPEHAGQVIGANLGPFIDKELLSKLGLETTELDDVEVALVGASHSSGVARGK